MQKKILLAVIVICTIATTVDAQIKKGAVFLGGDVGFSLSNTSYNQNSGFSSKAKDTYLNFSPVFGKAVKDNLIVGADLGYTYSKNENVYPAQKNNNYGIGVFVRQYRNLGKGFYIFGQARIGGGYNTQDATDLTTQPATEIKTKGYNVGINIYPGISYTITKKLQLETGFNNLAALTFSHSKAINESNTSTNVSNAFSLSSSLTNLSGFTLGFRVLLN